MTRGRKIALWIGGGLLGLILTLGLAIFVTVQTQWFRDFVRAKIVTSVEEATGGRVELGSFAFTWNRLRADVHDFVIHGLEPAGAAPLFRAKHVQVDLKLLSPLKGFVELAYLLVDTPQANLMVFPDGKTNIPAPKIKKTSDKTGLETIVDLAIGRFDLVNASAAFASAPAAINASGRDLRAHLAYNALKPSYTGDLSTTLLVRSGNNDPVNANVKLPVTLEKDKVTLTNATVETPQSKIVISGSVENLAAPTPTSSAHINASIALDEVRRAAGLTIPLDLRAGPQFLTADITAAADDKTVRIQSARANLGASSIEASGTLKEQNKPGAVEFNATLALNELGRMLKLAQRPEGVVKVGGNAALRENNDYLITANVSARNVAIQQGTTRLRNIALDSAVTADPHRIELDGLRLSALGGTFSGDAVIQELQQFRVNGKLASFDIGTVAGAFLDRPLGYSGVVSGPVQAEGDLKNPNAIVARANLAIAPGRRGVPVSGKLNVDYNGRGDTVQLAQSFIQLPHTRVDLSGSLNQQIQARIVSRDLSDFRPLGNIPVALENGVATVNATVRGSLSNPRVTAHAEVTNFAVENRQFSRFGADITASATGAAATNAVLTRGPLQANFAGTVGLRNWKPENNQPLKVDATIRNGDVADVLALAGQSDINATGALSMDAHIAGTVGSPTGTADLRVVNGTIEGEPFDSLTARANMTPQTIDVPSLSLVAGPSRIDANATYQHPLNDLSRGTVRAHVASNQVQLAQFQSLVKDRPGLRGILSLNGDVTGNIAPNTDFQIASLKADLGVRGLQMEGRNLGDLTATATSSGSAIDYNVNSDFAGSTIRVNGRSLLTGNHDTTATASIANLPIEQALVVAGRRDIPVRGTLSADAKLSGTTQAPVVNATLTIANGVAYQEPFDRLQADIGYTNTAIDLRSARLEAGPSNLSATGNFTHPAGDMENGQVKFRVESNQLQLARFKTIQNAKPGLAGAVQLVADGAATLRKGAAPLFSTLNANLSARGLAVENKPLGDLTATATTKGQDVVFDLNSNIARADIRGAGRMTLAGDYPLDAKLTFNNLTYSGLRPLLGGDQQAFDASANGQITVTGPASKTDQLRGTVEIARLVANSAPAQPGRKPRVEFELHNEGPIVAALDKSVITVRSAHIVGPFTDVSLTGTASIADPKSMNLRANGKVRLELIEAFSPNVFSSGNVSLNAAVTGTMDKPVVNGALKLENASFNMLDVPNGLSNANGTVTFSGTQAIIQNLTGETGGGKVTLGGFVTYGGPELTFRVTANADRIRVTAPENLTTQASARLVAAGTTTRSLVSGTVTIEDIAMRSNSDVGSILNQAAAPPSAKTASTGVLAGMRLDVKIQTAPEVQVRTTLTQNVRLDANLNLRGTPDNPGMIGRVVVTQGEVVFFGSKYNIDQGTVSFFNPNRVNPILNIDLETTVQGIDVTLSVTGPVDRMKLSYRSEPPMPFTDLVSLLASGKPPTTDPVLAARAPSAPQQNLQQAGASTLLGQAVANPVSGRLQRLFGVSRLKIDPQITGSTNTPQATMTLQQQISRDITFTYIQDVTQSNPQIIRIEWAIDPHWAAIAQRDRNGMFNINFFYKKRFR
jgi:translocation and assembly module TamB